MKLGLHYWNYSTPADPATIAATLAETARIAEQAGFSAFTVMDHFFQMEMAAVLGRRADAGGLHHPGLCGGQDRADDASGCWSPG